MSKADPGQTSGDGAIFGKDDADLSIRQAGGYKRTFKRIYEVQFRQTTSNAGIDALAERLKFNGSATWSWYVIPLDSALPMSIMPCQWEAIMQDVRRVRIDGLLPVMQCLFPLHHHHHADDITNCHDT